jgi:hypothetical protein
MQDLAGFYFAGAGTVPGFLFYSAEPGLAVMAMLVLMLAGCLMGMADPQAPFRTMKGPDEPGPER